MRAIQLDCRYLVRLLLAISSSSMVLLALSACSSEPSAVIDQAWPKWSTVDDQLTLEVSHHDNSRLVVRSSTGNHGAVADGVYLLTVQADRGTVSVMQITQDLDFELVESRPVDEVEAYCIAMQEEAIASKGPDDGSAAELRNFSDVDPSVRPQTPLDYGPIQPRGNDTSELHSPQDDDSLTPSLTTVPQHQELKI